MLDWRHDCISWIRFAPPLSRLAFHLAIVALLISSTTRADDTPNSIPITGDRLSGFVLPIEPLQTNVEFRALKAWAWTIDDTKRLLLQGDVQITIGSYSFLSDKAAVWINRIPSANGVINQFAMYFDEVRDPTKQAGLGVDGSKLLVTASTRGDVTLNVALMRNEKPNVSAFLTQAESRLADHLQSLISQPATLRKRPRIEKPAHIPPFIPVPGGSVPQEAAASQPAHIDIPAPAQQTPWLAGPQGTVRFTAKQIDITRGEEENVITAIGDIVLEIISDRGNGPEDHLTITATRAVIFTDPGPLVGGDQELSVKNVRGVYLEGNVMVATHGGEYYVRAPQVYYDFRTEKAIMLESLLRVQPRDIRVPIYARAEEMRQLAENQWEARHVTVSTSEFAVPHLAIGARQATITRSHPAEGERVVTNVDSRDNTLRIEDVPIFWWPRFKGDAERVPLRDITVGTRSNDGLRLQTTWDFFSLTGIQQPEGVDADLKLDAFTKRGAAIGGALRYDVADSEGKVDLYGLYDTGIDRTSSGRNVDPDQNLRGVAILENQTQLSQYWSLQAQLSLISDETFITSWREDDFAERREYETSLYLKYQRDNTAFTVLGKYALQDFLSNSYLLASRQYSVDKTPELTYRRYGDSLFGDSITYSTENRLTRMSLVFVHATPRELGVPGAAFGIPNNVLISDALLARGVRENWVDRFDTRHELALPLHPGIFNVTPFVVGRFTGYDDDFDAFSSDADQMRFFGAAGVRVNTQFQHIDNSVESRSFDLHRLRHIVEPYVTLWTAYASVDQSDLPIYDEEVESLADGSAVQVGVRNVLQTQRGGPGQWRSVDWITLDTSVVIDSEGKPNESPTPQFFDYRPEYSQFGDHVRTQATWLASDNLTFGGEAIYDIENDTIARGSIGVELRHSPVLITFVEFRYIDANDSELLDFGWIYQITPKYRFMLNPQYDFNEGEFRTLSLRVTRSFPDFDLTFVIRYDQVRDDTLFGASLGLAKF